MSDKRRLIPYAGFDPNEREITKPPRDLPPRPWRPITRASWLARLRSNYARVLAELHQQDEVRT